MYACIYYVCMHTHNNEQMSRRGKTEIRIYFWVQKLTFQMYPCP